jgi:hypothetical protein
VVRNITMPYTWQMVGVITPAYLIELDFSSAAVRESVSIGEGYENCQNAFSNIMFSCLKPGWCPVVLVLRDRDI